VSEEKPLQTFFNHDLVTLTMNAKNVVKLLLSLGACLSAGAIGSIFNIAAIPTWYVTLNKPFFSPPNWIFAPVWTALFIMMGASLYLVWKEGFGKVDVKKGVHIFSIQLVLNLLWSAVFFGLKAPLAAFIEIIALWVFIWLTIKQFKKVSKTAAWLLVPYLCWVSFATLLTLSIWVLN